MVKIVLLMLLLVPITGFAQSSSLINQAQAFVSSLNIPTQQINPRAFRFNNTQQGKTWVMFVFEREAVNQLLIYSVFPHAIPAAHRQTAMEFITRANYGMSIGNFEMDLSDGEIRYKTSLDARGVAINDTILNVLLQTNASIMFQYWEGFEGIRRGELNAIQAIQLTEG